MKFKIKVRLELSKDKNTLTQKNELLKRIDEIE